MLGRVWEPWGHSCQYALSTIGKSKRSNFSRRHGNVFLDSPPLLPLTVFLGSKVYCQCGVVEDEREVGLGYISSAKRSPGVENLAPDHFQINFLCGTVGGLPDSMAGKVPMRVPKLHTLNRPRTLSGRSSRRYHGTPLPGMSLKFIYHTADATLPYARCRHPLAGWVSVCRGRRRLLQFMRGIIN